jgi:hypothetical protein
MESSQHVVQNTRGPVGLFHQWNHHNGVCRRVVSRPEPFGFHGRILLSSDFHRSSNFDHDALDSSSADCPRVLVFLLYGSLSCSSNPSCLEVPLTSGCHWTVSSMELTHPCLGSCCWRQSCRRSTHVLAPCGSFNGAIHRGHRNLCRGLTWSPFRWEFSWSSTGIAERGSNRVLKWACY